MRAWVCMGMITFIGVYYKDHFAGWSLLGYDIGVIGYAITLFVFIFANAIGGSSAAGRRTGSARSR